MSGYTILCDCGSPASYKIAARWSDGVTSELKTYFLCCGECVRSCFHEALKRQAACPLALDEILDRPEIFELGSETRRREDLEHQ